MRSIALLFKTLNPRRTLPFRRILRVSWVPRGGRPLRRVCVAGDAPGRVAKVFRSGRFGPARPPPPLWAASRAAWARLRANVQGRVLGPQTAPGGHRPSSVCTESSLAGEWADSSRRGLRPASSSWFPSSDSLLFPVPPVCYISGICRRPDFHVSHHKQSLPRCPSPAG